MTAIPYLTPGVRSFTDRSTMLLVVGIFLILGGFMAGCGVLSMPMAMFLPRPTTSAGAPAYARPSWAQMIPGMATYVVASVSMFALGIGAILKRRWVRPVILVLAWLGLIIGVGAAVFVGVIFPDIVRNMQANMPAPAPGTAGPPMRFIVIIMGTVAGIMALLYILIPALLIFLFKGTDVQATLEFHDPNPRWTDGVPIPVLALAALLALGGFWMLIFALQGVLPLFGVFLGGAAGRAALVAIAALNFFAAYRIYQRRIDGWWLGVALTILMTASACVTFFVADIAEVYRRSGVTEEQMKMMGGMMKMMGPLGAIWAALFGVGTVIFALRVRRHFDETPAPDVKLPA